VSSAGSSVSAALGLTNRSRDGKRAAPPSAALGASGFHCNYWKCVMARRCALTGKGVQTGNNVSHANNKTRRRFLPNIQSRRLFSETLGESVRIRIAAATLRTIEKRGGLDGYLENAAEASLPRDLVRLKRRVVSARASRTEA
jgi:large subunit ribosomal protein L28